MPQFTHRKVQFMSEGQFTTPQASIHARSAIRYISSGSLLGTPHPADATFSSRRRLLVWRLPLEGKLRRRRQFMREAQFVTPHPLSSSVHLIRLTPPSPQGEGFWFGGFHLRGSSAAGGDEVLSSICSRISLHTALNSRCICRFVYRKTVIPFFCIHASLSLSD